MAEAEYIMMTSVACEILYLQHLLEELYENVTLPIPIYCNSQGEIAIGLNDKFHARTKHINLHYHFIRGLIQNGMLECQYIPTAKNTADAFTKVLP